MPMSGSYSQARLRALRLGDQRQPVAVHDRQPDQFVGGLGQPVDHRLGDVDDTPDLLRKLSPMDAILVVSA